MSPPPPADTPPPGPRPDTVLVVDDEPDGRASLAWLLRHDGLRVIEAGSAATALVRAAEGPDLVVLDVVLPDGSGLDVCRRLKATPFPPPVLMVSGRAVGSGDRVHGLEGGADAYLTKPAEPAVLLAHCHALLRGRRAERVRRRADAVLEATSDAFVAVDRNWRFTYLNPRAEQLLRRPLADLIGRSVWDVCPDSTGTPFEREYRRAMADRVPTEVADYCPSVRAWVEVRAVPLDDGLVLLLRDVTERRKLEDQLRQAQKMEAVGQLAGGVAHDFNNLLTLITGYGELAIGLLPDDHPARGLVDEIRRAGDRAAGLTRQLLAFSRKAVVTPRVLDLNAVVLDTERMLRRLLGEDLDLACRPAPGLWPVRADPGLVEQVLMNLCVNARDAMPRGGKLTVETANVRLGEEYARTHAGVTPGKYVLLAVADTGPGIPPDVLPHIFEPFFTTKPAGKGTGLGLATVHGIVEQSGGHVEVYTEVGVGTTFKVYLPRDEEAGRTGAPGSGVVAPPRGTETVLLVEDEAAVRALGALVLRGAGYTVLEAGSGEEALEAAAREADPVQLLVTDVVMPGVGGRELADRLRAAQPAVRVLFTSGYTDDAVVRHGILADRVEFLQKPYTPSVLALKVREVLDRGR